jgi:hypothetical protein
MAAKEPTTGNSTPVSTATKNRRSKAFVVTRALWPFESAHSVDKLIAHFGFARDDVARFFGTPTAACCVD